MCRLKHRAKIITLYILLYTQGDNFHPQVGVMGVTIFITMKPVLLSADAGEADDKKLHLAILMMNSFDLFLLY